MSDHENDTTSNLEFFKAAILEPALTTQSLFESEKPGSTVSDFGAIEAANWALLGGLIGYFDGKDAQELISSSQGIFKAWSNLHDRQIISPEEEWARIIRPTESGLPTLNEELFLVVVGIDPRTLELLHNTFQTFLLLTAENVLNYDSRYFLDSIGWTDDEEWAARRTAGTYQGSVRGLGAGFANVLNYWGEISSSFRSAQHRSRYIDVFGPLARVEISKLTQDVRAILSRRFNLGQIEIVYRYFALAGEFANRAREDSPAWLDARVDIFNNLKFLITYAGGGDSMSGHETPLWNVFARGMESSLAEDEIRPVKGSSKKPSIWEQESTGEE